MVLARRIGLDVAPITADVAGKRNYLLDAVIFSIAIGNVDSHAKTYSILLGQGAPRLAPLYDLMSGLAWSNIPQNHAQAIGGQRRGRHIYGRHWRRMAEAACLAARGTIRRVEQVTTRLLRELPAAVEEVTAMPAGPAMLEVFARVIEERATEVGSHAGQEGTPDIAAAPADDAPPPGLALIPPTGTAETVLLPLQAFPLFIMPCNRAAFPADLEQRADR
ncbi:HipA domain-containing protein [Novosphingobium sp. KN65.2]|uniref:HipA domain-containing protein n=1 Tax=Novosphingobium sp. KN65.2 TaxID=1478134 RepID=UPI0005DBDF27|nr:HipA domain-containing protein [Novosphingobium sp. KN65.2]CDO35979.1 hypothetical protein SPHV1_2280123 [Novosphingobium sp. KN65.2]